MSSMHRAVLVLNRNWRAICIARFYQALTKIFKEQSFIVDPETYTEYDFLKWIELPVRDNDSFFLTTQGKIRCPELMRLRKYSGVPVFTVKLTRKNLLVRDGHRCAYTNKRLTLREATVDHIIPLSRGGKNHWGNVLLASAEANSKKGNRTPEEAGMQPLRKPFIPKWNPLYTGCASNIPESWTQWMKSYQQVNAPVRRK